MRIDLNPSAMPEAARSSDAAAGATSGDMTKLVAPDANDIAHLSSGRDAVQKLKTQLDALPEIRQQRVDALRQAISDGAYKISPHAVATAMLSDLRLKAG